MPLEARDGAFFLDGKKVRLMSGTIHYFRVLPEYWEDRLQKLKACGLNCVETYVAWNLIEEFKGQFNFEGRCDIRKFLEIAHRLNLYVIFRPGPYICAEWDLGGLPSWLLRDPAMKLRSSYQPYLDAVEKYLAKLMSVVGDLQHSSGGPIIAVQIENEYGSYGNDERYTTALTEMLRKVGVTEMLFTSDNASGIQIGHIPNVLVTANFQDLDQGQILYEFLKHIRQPGMPFMAMEFWAGWYDRWTEKHNHVDDKRFEETTRWLLKQEASINFYVFHGGTNFGFMNGANADASEPGCFGYTPVTTSYDYDSPVAENGNLTEKYHIIRKLLREFCPDECPEAGKELTISSVSETKAYGQLVIKDYLNFEDMLQFIEPVKSKTPLTMEELPINNGNGQTYGFILYRKNIPDSSNKLTLPGKVNDRAIVLLNGKVVETVDHKKPDHQVPLKTVSGTENKLDILVENCGRVNYCGFNSSLLNEQRKGLKEIRLNKNAVHDWTIYPIEMRKEFVEKVWASDKWTSQCPEPANGPRLCRAVLNIPDKPVDTFVSMKGWKKGVVFVNSVNIGRYWDVGPQVTLYIPAPLLKTGENQILIFELHESVGSVAFEDKHEFTETIIYKAVLPMSAQLQIGMLSKVIKMGDWVWPILRIFLK